jgi:hypothetical protein
MTKLGRDLIRSAKEAAAIASGEADPATYRVHVPAEMDKASTGERTSSPLPARGERASRRKPRSEPEGRG